MTTRRDFLIKSGQVLTLTTISPLLVSCNSTQENTNAVEHQLPKLSYGYQDLEPFIDKETMEIHHSKHHQGYVNKLNKALVGQKNLQGKSVEELLKKLDDIPGSIRESVRNNAGGHYNHSIFWDSMTPNKNGETLKPSGKLLAAIERDFSSFDAFKENFSKTTTGIFGSGWGWLVSSGGKLEILTTENQDNPISQGKTPILGLDVWEHAYYLKYQNLRGDYVKAWWNTLNWSNISMRFEKLS